MATEYRTTSGAYGRYSDRRSHADDPQPPNGEGWKMCGSAAADGNLYWFWEREEPKQEE